MNVPTTRKNVTLISRNFPPLTGGMERLVYKTYIGLTGKFNTTLIGPRGCTKYTEPSTHAYEAPIKSVSLFLITALVKGALHHLRNGRAAIFIGGSGVVAPVVYILSRLFSSRNILMIHGLDIVADNFIY